VPLAADISLSSIASSIAKGYARTVTFRSQVTPDYTYDPWAPSPPQPPSSTTNWLMDIVKPEITLHGDLGDVVIAPYGTPTENYVPYILLGTAAMVVGSIAIIAWIARATKK
jgi:hypothetical protein